MTAKWILPLAIAIAIFAAGCGDSEDSTASNSGNGNSSGASNGSSNAGSGRGASDGGATITASLDKEEYLRTVDKICYDAKEEQALALVRYRKENPEKSKNRLDAGQEAVQTILVPGVRDLVAEVREIDPPKELEQTMETILDGLEKGTDQIESEGISKDAALRRAFLPAGDIALKNHLPGCAYGN